MARPPPDRTWSPDVCAASGLAQSLPGYVCHTAQSFLIRNKGAMVLRGLDHILGTKTQVAVL